MSLRLNLECPVLSPGQVPLVTVSDKGGRGFVWAFGLSVASGGTPFGARAMAAWHDAVTAAADVSPVLWISPETIRNRPLAALALGGWSEAPTSLVPEPILDGSSFGLSFLISQVSWLLGEPAADGVIASVEVGARGDLRPVEGLREKVEAVVAAAPGVDRLLIHASQAAKAIGLSRGRLEIVPVETANAALNHAFRAPLVSLVIERGRDSSKRDEIVQALFRRTTTSALAPGTWTAIADAARLGRTWPGLSDVDAFRLGYAQAVAERHQDNGGDMPWPAPAGFVDALPPEQRVPMLANIVQQATDRGFPPWEAVAEFVERDLPGSPDSAWPAQLRLAGAVARLKWTRGDLEGSLGDQLALASEWMRREEATDASFPLSEAYRLASVLKDEQAFSALELLGSPAAGDVRSLPYVSLNRGRALANLGRPELAIAALRGLPNGRAPSHVRYSAARLLSRLRVDVAAVEAEMRTASEASPDTPLGRHRQAASVFLALMDLDQRAAGADDPGPALARLHELMPTVMSWLLTLSAKRGWAVHEGVARAFPY